MDYRSRLNPRFKKIKRQKTKYIIVHTAELGRQTTLRVVSQGKRFRNGRSTPGGHAHYVIAGEDFDSSATVYKFPDGRIYTGDQVAAEVGWHLLPAKTTVLLNQEVGVEKLKDDGPVKTIADGVTAWALAGRSYNRETTIYFLPAGHIKTGSVIDDWDDLPVQTRLIS